MDKISKFLLKLSAKEFQIAEETIEQILSGDIEALQVKKLKGTTHVFRVRKGEVRIIFLRKNGIVRILEVDRRSEGTYRDV